MGDTRLELKNLSKSFGANQVLFDVSFSLKRGEVHAIIGENGAGKSTMMNITYGLVKPDRGEIYIDGVKADIKNAADAQKHGVCFVHQEIALCPELTVAQNIFMSRIKDMRSWNINYHKLNAQAQELLDSIVTGIDASAPVESLSISNQQVVEIAKALSGDCRVLILDEPTASLSESETESLYEIMRKLKAQGIGIIFISHRLSEIFGQCDRVSVLRDGYMINTYGVGEVDAAQLVNDMAGREIKNIYPPKAEAPDYSDGGSLLQVEGLTDGAGRFADVSFQLHKGEILGFSGLIGSGRSEVMQAIVGLRRAKGGRAVFEGRDIIGQRTKRTFSQGLVYLSEDRKNSGLFLDMDISQNVSAMHMETVQRGIVMDSALERRQAEKFITALRVKCSGAGQALRSLSGGNQQKVMISKLLTKKPKIVIMDEPTRGVDVGAKSEIHGLLRGLANEGTGVIVVSSELNEIVGMCDRVLVMHEGELVAEVRGEDVNSNRIMHYASGAYKLAAGQ